MPKKAATPKKSSKSDQFRGSPKKQKNTTKTTSKSKLFGNTNPERLAPKNPKRVSKKPQADPLGEQFASDGEIENVLRSDEDNEDNENESYEENENDKEEDADVELVEEIDANEANKTKEGKTTEKANKTLKQPAAENTSFSPAKKKTKTGETTSKAVPKTMSFESPERKRKNPKLRSASHLFFNACILPDEHECKFHECGHRKIKAGTTTHMWGHLDMHERWLKNIRQLADDGKDVTKLAEKAIADANKEYEKNNRNLDAFLSKAKKSNIKTKRNMSFLLCVAENGWSFNSAASERFLSYMNEFHDTNYPSRKELAGPYLWGERNY